MKKNYALLLFSFFSLTLLAQTPYASYPLDGNANDVAGNNLHGTINGSPTTTSNRNNMNGTALLFDGSSDYIQLPSTFDFPNRSLIIWINATQIGGGTDGINVAYACDYSSIQNGASVIATVNDANSGGDIIRMVCDQFYYSASANEGQWYQLAITRSPSLVKFYVNGVVVYTGNNPNGNHSGNGTAKAYVACSRNVNEFFNGKIDDISIYTSVVPDDVISQNYTDISEFHSVDESVKVFASNNIIHYQLAEETLELVNSVYLYDVSGKLIAETTPTLSGEMNSFSLDSGVYFVSFSLKNSTKTVSRKIVIGN